MGSSPQLASPLVARSFVAKVVWAWQGRPVNLWWLGAASLLLTGAAYAAPGQQAEALARYQQERAACLGGNTGQERNACLREAAAALQEARRGGLNDGAQAAAKYEANRRYRCEGLPEQERLACLARIGGQGTTSGSVAGGGIYRELVTKVPADKP